MRMRLSSAGLLLLASLAAARTFREDVMLQKSGRVSAQHIDEANIRSELLSKAVPLKAYELSRQVAEHRHLDNNNQDDGQYKYSFTGYSLKYAKCQPVQYFSPDAIAAGEHSPMITEDIVILRLCPQSSCTEGREYGCSYNYAEYAIDLSDYVGIMLKYSAQKKEYICDWCEECISSNGNENRRRRRLDDANDAQNDNNAEENQADGDNQNGEDEADQGAEDNQDGQGNDQQQEAQADEGNEDIEEEDQGEQDQQEEQNDGEVAENGDDGQNAGSCDGYDTYCSDYDTECGNNDDTYLDFEGYLDYLDCSQVDYNGYAYFVRPRCDGSSGTIKMAVYYDNYCGQYAGNEVSVKNLGLKIREGIFADFYSGTCIDCSESDYPPYFDANREMCNNVHSASAKCTTEMAYDLFQYDEGDESTECSFIESLRLGTYNQNGQLSSSLSSVNVDATVTSGQRTFLAITISACVVFIIYACYLHHAMTNLLIKSLSHRELLPPSRQNSRRSPSIPRRGSRRLKKVGDDDSDWGKSNTGSMA